MKTIATAINVLAFTVLFFDYAVAMQPVAPAGMRRTLQIFVGQLPTGAHPTIKPVWQLGYEMSDMV
ncbi:hypothetical protein [Rhizobium sp.]